MTPLMRRHAIKLVQVLAVGITVQAAFSTPVTAQPPVLVVSVAASVNDALDEIGRLYRAATGVTVALNPGGSNTLARQIAEGAKAGLFLSADEAQMDVVEKAGRIVPGTRTRLLTNELVVVAPLDRVGVTINDLLLGKNMRIAMGDPNAVPAGVYAKRWLQHEGNQWERIALRVVPFPTVRAVLSAVENGRVDGGVVYRTDAMAGKVRVVAPIPSVLHPYLDISYPVAVIAGPSEKEARRFLDFLKSQRARDVFTRRGFGIAQEK
jgi:molybdate transport system substrate-binding protein